jgi:hypothetical protein
MNIFNQGIEMSVVWFDEDVIELYVLGSNGRFSGATNIYINRITLTEIANVFRGFPESIEDQRELLIGTFDPGYAGGGVKIRLRSLDKVGHSEVEFVVRAVSEYRAGQNETANFYIPVEPAAIDEFVVAISMMEIEVGSTVNLISR